MTTEVTLRILQRVRSSTLDNHFPVAVRERLKISSATALRNVEAIKERMGEATWDSIHTRVEALVRSRDPVWPRLRALYELIDEYNSYAAPSGACRRGCAHCCHIQAVMFEPEARMLGAELRLRPKDVSTSGRTVQDFERREYGYHTPCTFLKNNECSIYEHRPMACRTLVNLDEDALLCELLPPPHAPTVPYMNMMLFQIAYVQICKSTRTGDIREYFPSPGDTP